jgi:hypothetical protein
LKACVNHGIHRVLRFTGSAVVLLFCCCFVVLWGGECLVNGA